MTYSIGLNFLRYFLRDLVHCKLLARLFLMCKIAYILKKLLIKD